MSGSSFACTHSRTECLPCLYRTYLGNSGLTYACPQLRELYITRFFYRHREEVRALLHRHTIAIISALQELNQDAVKILCLGAGAAPELAGLIDWMHDVGLRELLLEVKLLDNESGWQHGFTSMSKSVAVRVHELGLRISLLCLNHDVLDYKSTKERPNIITLNYILSALPNNSIPHIAELCAANLSKPGVVLIIDHGTEEMRIQVETLTTLIKCFHPTAEVQYHFSATGTQCVLIL